MREMWKSPTFPTFLTGILKMYGGPWASSVVVHHAADVDRPGQISIAEPAVQRFQGVGSSCINVDTVPVLVAVVQAGQGQVEGRGFLTAAEHGVGGLGQYFGGSPKTDVPSAEEAVPQMGAKSSRSPLRVPRDPKKSVGRSERKAGTKHGIVSIPNPARFMCTECRKPAWQANFHGRHTHCESSQKSSPNGIYFLNAP